MAKLYPNPMFKDGKIVTSYNPNQFIDSPTDMYWGREAPVSLPFLPTMEKEKVFSPGKQCCKIKMGLLKKVHSHSVHSFFGKIKSFSNSLYLGNRRLSHRRCRLYRRIIDRYGRKKTRFRLLGRSHRKP